MTISDFLCKVIINIIHKGDARGVVRNNSGFSHFRHRANRKTRNKIMNKRRIEVKNIMFVKKVIKSLRIIRRNDSIKNVRIRVEIRIKNTVHNRRREVDRKSVV